MQWGWCLIGARDSLFVEEGVGKRTGGCTGAVLWIFVHGCVRVGRPSLVWLPSVQGCSLLNALQVLLRPGAIYLLCGVSAEVRAGCMERFCKRLHIVPLWPGGRMRWRRTVRLVYSRS